MIRYESYHTDRVQHTVTVREVRNTADGINGWADIGEDTTSSDSFDSTRPMELRKLHTGMEYFHYADEPYDKW